MRRDARELLKFSAIVLVVATLFLVAGAVLAGQLSGVGVARSLDLLVFGLGWAGAVCLGATGLLLLLLTAAVWADVLVKKDEGE